MDKNEKIIIRSFVDMDIPQDFIVSLGRELFISTLIGYAQQLLKNGFVNIKNKNELEIAEEDFKKESKHFVFSKHENIIYYNMIKSCLLIIYKYCM